MQNLLNQQLTKFNERIKTDEKMQKELENIDRKIQIDITDGPTFITQLKDLHAEEIKEGTYENPDVIITVNEATLRSLINKEISPIKAFLITKQLKIKASLEDKLMLRKLFD